MNANAYAGIYRLLVLVICCQVIHGRVGACAMNCRQKEEGIPFVMPMLKTKGKTIIDTIPA